MAVFVLFLLVLLAWALPGLCPRFLSVDAHPPDLWLVTTVYLALAGRGFRAVGWAIALGAVRDCLSLDPLGTHAFVLGTVAFLFCEGRSPRARLDGLPRVVFTGLAALLAGWLYLMRLLPLGGGAVQPADFLHAVPTALWTLLLAAGLFPLLDHFRLLDDLLGRRHGLPA